MVKKSIMGRWMVVGIVALSALTIVGCQAHEGSEEQLKTDVDSFATYYYNWHFAQAAKYCTPESERWLRYAASNVHEADVELLRKKEEDATFEIKDIDFGDDKVTANVVVTVCNFLQMDTIGQAAHLVEQADFHLPMELSQGKWKVKLDKLPAHF